jgi:transposase InsO family protein
MQYYTFELDEASQELCVIVTPFGKFKYLRLPMGIKQSPDVAQEIMEDVLRGIANVEVYIDDIGVFSDSWEEHLATLRRVLQRLQDNGFTVNPAKCEWAVQETDWLGYWLTPHGLKPWSKKIDAILHMQPPTNVKQLRSFLGAVTYYRDMWPHRSHILAPLTELTGTGRFTWSKRQQQAFDAMKALIAEDTMLRYPDHNQPFHIYTDASDYQLGAAIMQNNHPVAFYSRKLSPAQKNYTTIEKELLSVVATFQEFYSMLYGAEIHVHTDHRNLTFTNLTSQRVLRWRLFIEEFAPTFHYIRGTDNRLADALSRVPIEPSSSASEVPSLEEKSSPPRAWLHESPTEPVNDADLELLPTCAANWNQWSVYSNDNLSIINNRELLECFLMYPEQTNIPFPLNYEQLQRDQFDDMSLQLAREQSPQRYPIETFGNTNLICYQRRQDEDWKIALPTHRLTDIVQWYHAVLNHVGMSKLFDTIATHLYHPELRARVQEVVGKCAVCQKYKSSGPGYGELPPRTAPLAPWEEVAVDLIGPWTIKVHEQELVFRALTCIDNVTNLTELSLIQNKSSAHVAMKFENEWLARYPKPVKCIYDHGTEFTGAEFQSLLTRYGIKKSPTSTKNPQANSICERMHLSVTNILRPLLHAHYPQTLQAAAVMATALAQVTHAFRCAVHRSLKVSPGALVFHRDMILDLPLVSDLALIQNNRQMLIDENLRRQNLKRRTYDYQVGQNILILNSSLHPRKLDPIAPDGPFPIVQVHTNGTVTIRKSPLVTERINIRRIRPFRS